MAERPRFFQVISDILDWAQAPVTQPDGESMNNYCPYRTIVPYEQAKCAISKPYLHSECVQPLGSLEDCPVGNYGKRPPDLCDVIGISQIPVIKDS